MEDYRWRTFFSELLGNGKNLHEEWPGFRKSKFDLQWR